MSTIKLKARCPYCGELFIKNRPKQLYCNDNHRKANHRKSKNATIQLKHVDDTLEGNVLYDILVDLKPKTNVDDDFFC